MRDALKKSNVIQLKSKHPEFVPAFSKETLFQWKTLLQPEKTNNLLLSLHAILFHGLLLTIMFILPPGKVSEQPYSTDSGIGGVKVTVMPGKSFAPPVQLQKDPPAVPVAPQNSQSVPQGRIATQSSPSSVLIPKENAAPEENINPVAQEFGPSILDKKFDNLLPNSSSEFLGKQDKVTDSLSDGAVTGDISDDTASGDPRAQFRTKQKIVQVDHTYDGYVMQMSKRFSEAWGGTRVLPVDSFQGVAGELIQYDVVINRDGTLRKIVNITALNQEGRNFESVDKLVATVFKAVFPFNPIPSRIDRDPLVIRKAIRFTGNHYGILW